MEEEAENNKGSKNSASAVRYATARSRTIFEMARKAADAANQSGKATLRIFKEKQLHHHRQELEQIISKIIDGQHGLCALTNLPLQWEETAEDPEMISSLDRIDSDGHYAETNLQVVCRFVNRWKFKSPDGEFRRLLAIVRSDFSEAKN